MFQTCVRVMTTQLIGTITTIVRIITNLCPINTFLVGTLELRIHVARFLSQRTFGHIVFIGSIATIVDAVTHLIPCHTSMIVALESSQCVTIQIRAHRRSLIRIITAVIGAVTQIGRRNAQIICALES